MSTPHKSNRSGRSLTGRNGRSDRAAATQRLAEERRIAGNSQEPERAGIDHLEAQAVISKPRPDPRIMRFLTAVHRQVREMRRALENWANDLTVASRPLLGIALAQAVA